MVLWQWVGLGVLIVVFALMGAKVLDEWAEAVLADDVDEHEHEQGLDL